MDYTSVLAKLTSRKFVLSFVAIAMTGILAYLKVLDQTAYSSVVITITGAYLASNVFQDIKYLENRE